MVATWLLHLYKSLTYDVFCCLCVPVQAGEPFKVYVVTPLHPEGIPTSGSVQVSRRWSCLRIACILVT